MAELLMTTTREQQRKASKMHAAISPDTCGLCRATVTMITVLKCRQCGAQCCKNCNAQPYSGRVICKACE